jgi:haloacetate dehalogenase
MPIEGFERSEVATGEITLSVHRGGTGTPLILLHGFPENHACWAKVAPRLAQDHDVVVPDLRGYGASEAPPDDESHTVYSKRRMARDIVGLMDALGLERAHVLGHDRGARVAYRLALDAPERVDRLGIIEIVPTSDFWRMWDARVAMAAYHWTFLAQDAPLPERLIGAAPGFFIEETMRRWTRGHTLAPFAPEALASYVAQAADPGRLAAMCADYRAGATTDRHLDEADRAAARKIAAPVHFLCSDRGFPARTGMPDDLWMGWAERVTTSTCASGHFVPEEDPQAVLDAFLPFFAAG